MCVCVVIPFILDVRFVYVLAGVTQEEGHTGFLPFPPAVLALIFIARKIQPFLSHVNREVTFCEPTNKSFSIRWAFIYFERKTPIRVTARPNVRRFRGLVLLCVFFPFILDIKFVGRTSRGHTGGRSQDFSSTFLLRCMP